ncbi:hypothetical protein EAH78_08300 [Pseudomonas arsenicoxydans]|uniref:Uncharacterized protein n=1 Tax=Pseudomonas arsenicoxydans TaxID=702115 RepID=A0A502I2Y3_9PSED|nr:hypothetical protein EAH78_08300 [Pseudomonas arsenicoxydans]
MPVNSPQIPLWRGSLLPLGCEAALKPGNAVSQAEHIGKITTAAQPSGSKLPRHKSSHRGHRWAAMASTDSRINAGPL